ncbi:DNA-directed RNA polymerase subunit delta [Virgibacillus halophilus]|uniref:Probable DNA-directed RNA polymerase subunit delta n=1 Tax=Tigheibacillus halophilus TaxID=361280 RepID=A0ABU5C4Y2_9BACI|nr:DNA-directed RNA polymerase subunit delta [Virgibacillus halophilus]
MSLKSMNKDELQNKAMIDLATMILTEEKKAMDFHDIYEKVADIKGFTGEGKEEALVQFYTDLNVDGQFLTLGSNMWGLKRWYPVEQIDEDITAEPKKKKTKKKSPAKKKKLDDELDMEEIVVDENMKEDYDPREEDADAFENDYDELDEEDLDEEDYDDFEEDEDDLDDEEEEENK